MSRLIKFIFSEIELQLRVKNPVKAKMFSAFSLFALGDITVQFAVEKTQKWDKLRTLR